MQLDGFSIEAQKIVCLKYANEQGYEVLDSHIYIDEAYSAKNEDRPEFKRLMIGAHSSEFSLIIIHRMDRFERNFRAMANTLEDKIMKSIAKGRNDIHKIDMEVTPKELGCMMQQAVLSRDAEDLSGFVTMFDESGNLCRQYDDGHSERIEVSGN